MSKKQHHSLIPPKGDKDVGKVVFTLLEQSVRDKKDIGLHTKVMRNYELRKSRHWRNKDKNLPYAVANLLNSHLTKNVNLLCDNNPIFNVAKAGELTFEQRENIDLVQRTAEHWWSEQEQQSLFEDSVLQGELYGVTIEHVRFNSELEWGLGEVETVIIDPLYFGFYPTNLKSPHELQSAEAIFYFYPMSVREIKRRWPDKAKDVKPDSELANLIEDDRGDRDSGTDASKTLYGAFITLSNELKQLLSFSHGDGGDEENTLVCECWTKDYTLIDYEEDSDEGGLSFLEDLGNTQRPAEEEVSKGNEFNTTITGKAAQESPVNNKEIAEPQPSSSPIIPIYGKKVPKYPGYIRRIIACNGGKVILSDDPNPSINPNLDFDNVRSSYLFDKYPFYARNSARDTSNFWGIADSEGLDGLNMEFNKCLSQMILMKDKKARSKIINPMTSGVSNSEFSNVSGVIQPVNAIEGQGIRYLTFDGDLADFSNVAAMIKEIFFTVAGTFELENANTPGREVIAYKAIAALIEQASTMRKGKIRAYSALIRERGRCFVSLAQNWYTDTERWIVYEEDGDRKTKPITAYNLRVPAKLSVVTGSTMPISNVQKREEAISLFQMKAIDQEALLDELNVSNRKNILMRMKQGPFGSLIHRLQELGFPEVLCTYLKTIGMLDDKNYQRGIEKGEFPDFMTIFQRVMEVLNPQQEGEQPALPPPDPLAELEKEEREAKIMEIKMKISKTQAEVERARAEIEKIRRDEKLVDQKIQSEKVDQLVKLEGVNFDKEKLSIERKKVMADVRKNAVEPDKGKQYESVQGYKEKGIKSNNE